MACCQNLSHVTLQAGVAISFAGQTDGTMLFKLYFMFVQRAWQLYLPLEH